MRVLGARFRLTVSGTRDQRIAQIAGHQRGLVARRQLLAAGVARSSIAMLAAQGRLLSVHRGVYAVGHASPAPLARETAALLAVREGAVVSHLSAAALWGMVARADETIHVTVPRSAGATRPGVTVHRARSLRPADVRIHLGLPVTCPARVLLEIAPTVTARTLELAYDRALVERILTRAEVAELVTRAVGHSGGRSVRRLLESACTTVTRSEAEERVLALIRAGGLPTPAVNARVCGYEVDFWWPGHRVVLEVDGFRYHGTRRAFEHDRRKGATLAAAGIVTTRVTWRQLESEQMAVVVRLAQALAAAGTGGGAASER